MKVIFKLQMCGTKIWGMGENCALYGKQFYYWSISSCHHSCYCHVVRSQPY